MLLLRVGRRKTAWEATTIDNLLKVEFRSGEGEGEIDLNPSVYMVDESQLVQTVAEHAAGIGLDPPRGLDNVNLDCDRPAASTPGDTGFEFTTAAHCELKFDSVQDLRAFLLNDILPRFAERRRVASKAQVRDYVRQRQAAGDPEWLSLIAKNKHWP